MPLNAFGGGVLYGEKVVRLVYIDSAGGSAKEPIVVVSGVIVHGDDQLIALKRRLVEIRDKHVPEEYLEPFIFHAMHIFQRNSKKYPNWPFEKRMLMVADMANLPVELNLTIVNASVEKVHHFTADIDNFGHFTTNERNITQVGSAFFQCLGMIEAWMRIFTTNENCILVVEDDNESRQLMRNVQNYNQSENEYIDYNGIGGKLYPLTRIQEDPLFQPKKKTNPLEMADLCAYLYKRGLNNIEDIATDFIRVFLPRIWAPSKEELS